MVDLYRASFRHVPGRVVPDVDDTFDAVHGGPRPRPFNAHDDGYGFQPIVVFDGQGRSVTAPLRPAKRPNGRKIRAPPRRLIRAIRDHRPRTAIPVRADGHHACPGVPDRCEAHGIDDVVGLGPTGTLRRHVERPGAGTVARFAAAPHRGKVRRVKEFYDGAGTRSRVRRLVARVEAGPQGGDTRFIVTNLRHGTGRRPHEDPYCRRGRAENHVKAWKARLAADRTSCPAATANRFRPFPHAGADRPLWSPRAPMPRRSSRRVAQFDSPRLRLIRLAARVIELKTRVAVHLPTGAPDRAVLPLVLGRPPRLVT